MSPLNPVNLTYFEREKMGASVKAVTSHSPSDSLSRGTQLNHISFTEMDVYSELSTRGAGSVEGAGQASDQELPHRNLVLGAFCQGCLPPQTSHSTNQYNFKSQCVFTNFLFGLISKLKSTANYYLLSFRRGHFLIGKQQEILN